MVQGLETTSSSLEHWQTPRGAGARGAGLALSSSTDPAAVLGAQTPAEQRPPTAPSRGAGRHPRAGVATPESGRDHAGSLRAGGDRSREAAEGISSEFQPGSARRGSAGLCRPPLGDYRDTVRNGDSSPQEEPCPAEGCSGRCPEGCAEPGWGRVSPSRDVAAVPEPLLPGGGRAASGKQTCVCGEECLLRQVQPRRYFWSQEAPREGSLSGIDCTRWTWHL